MNGKHALTISLVVGIAAIAGTVAATKTIHLGRPAAKPAAASSSVATRSKALDRVEISLQKALKQKPPKLPALPAAVAAGGAPVAGSSAQQGQRVLYVRPAPIIRHVHRPGGHESEHESSHDSEHGGDGGGGGGFDD
jgi:hypothetical protein